MWNLVTYLQLDPKTVLSSRAGCALPPQGNYYLTLPIAVDKFREPVEPLRKGAEIAALPVAASGWRRISFQLCVCTCTGASALKHLCW